MAKYVVVAVAIAGLAVAAAYFFWPVPRPEAYTPSPQRPLAAVPTPSDDSEPTPEPRGTESPAPPPTASVPSIPAAGENAIHGRVVDTKGNGVVDAEVRAYEANRGAIRVTTDSEGHFVITDLAPGSYRVSAHAAGFNDAVLETVKTPATDVLLELLPCSVAYGAVVDASTNIPLTQFEVAYLETPPADESHWAAMTQASRVAWVPHSEVNGRFTISNVKSHTAFAVAARAQGYEPSYIVAPALGPGEQSEAIRIALRGAGRIFGRITDASGNPLASAAIHVGERWNRAPVEFADHEGRYELTGLVRGPITLWATHGHYVPASQSLVLDPGDQHEIDFVLDSGVAIVGLVTIGDAPMEGLEIVASGDQDLPAKRGVTESDGSYRIEGMVGVEYRVLARARAWAESRNFGALPDAQQVIPPNRTHEVTADFHFPAVTSSLRGIVTVEGKAPASGELHGDLFSEASVTRASTVLSANGEYRVDGLLPGVAHLTVEVVDTDGHTRTKLIDVSIPEATEVRLDVEFGGAATIHGRLDGVAPDDFAQIKLLKGAWTVDADDLQALIDLESLQVADSEVAPDGTFTLERVEIGEYTVVGLVVDFDPQNDDRIAGVRYVSDVISVQQDAPAEVLLVIPPADVP